MSNLLNQPVLILNASYEPLSIANAKRAVKLIMKGVAKAEENREEIVYSHKMWDENNGDFVDVNFYLPSVVRLLSYRNIPIRIHIVSRKNIYARDRHLCCYCTKKFSPKNLTLDHVIPKSKGGKDTYENLVTCCLECNQRKGDRLLGDIKDMKLHFNPKAVTIHTRRDILRNMGAEDPLWRKYLYYDNI
jgi:endo-1,4-beta-D-glucanase Y